VKPRGCSRPFDRAARERWVVAAQRHHAEAVVLAKERCCEAEHLSAALSTEQKRGGGVLLGQPQLPPNRRANLGAGPRVEPRVKDHPRGAPDPLGSEASLSSLCGSAVRSDDDEVDTGLDPEVRRKVREVREEDGEGAAGAGLTDGVAQDGVEVRGDRHHRGGGDRPELSGYPLAERHAEGPN